MSINGSTPSPSSSPDLNFFHWSLRDWEQTGICAVQIFVSAVCFFSLQFIVRWYLFGKWTFPTFSYFAHRAWRRSRRRSSTTVRIEGQPSKMQQMQNISANKKWRISNELVSLFHSVVSGSWALYSVLIYTGLLDDMVNFTHPVPRYLVILSTGYIIHDFSDLVINERSVRIIEILFHHVMVLIAFFTTLYTHKFLGVLMCGLLMELNSIFLHSRSLLNLYGQGKTSTSFRMIALLNIITFMLFRMVISVYLLYWQFTTAWSMAWPYTLVTLVVLLSFAVTNTVLCYRVMAADGLLGKRRARAPTQPSPIAHTQLPIDATTAIIVEDGGVMGPATDDESDDEGEEEDEVIP